MLGPRVGLYKLQGQILLKCPAPTPAGWNPQPELFVHCLTPLLPSALFLPQAADLGPSVTWPAGQTPWRGMAPASEPPAPWCPEPAATEDICGEQRCPTSQMWSKDGPTGHPSLGTSQGPTQAHQAIVSSCRLTGTTACRHLHPPSHSLQGPRKHT